MIKHIFLFAAFFSLAIGNVQAQFRTAEKKLIVKTEQSSIESLINSKNFEFIANTAYPTSGPSKNLVGSDYAMIFSPESIKSHLPYYGRAYSGMNMGRDKGMRFEGKPEEFIIEKNAKGYQIQSKVEAENDRFSITLTVSESGYATLTINSDNRGTISYYGEVISVQ